MTDNQRMAILEKAADFGLDGYGGNCGEAAIAINRLLLGNKGKYIGVFNKWLYRKQRRMAGHVVVIYGDNIYDAEGMWEGDAAKLPAIPEDIETWAQPGRDDPDYDFPSDKAAEEVEIVLLTEATIQVNFIQTGKPFEAIRKAIKVLGLN